MKKRKILYLLITILTISLLTACGNSGESGEKEIGNIESTDKNNQLAEQEEDSSEENETETFDQLIVDNDNIKATLISVEKIVDKTWDEEKIKVKFEVENKKDIAIEVQARGVSADGKMIDESMLTMSQEIQPGKRADAILTIQNYNGDLPEINEDMEMTLHIFSWDDDYTEDHVVNIEFK